MHNALHPPGISGSRQFCCPEQRRPHQTQPRTCFQAVPPPFAMAGARVERSFRLMRRSPFSRLLSLAAVFRRRRGDRPTCKHKRGGVVPSGFRSFSLRSVFTSCLAATRTTAERLQPVGCPICEVPRLLDGKRRLYFGWSGGSFLR